MLTCKYCNKQFKKKWTDQKYCSHSCSAIAGNLGRKQSQATKNKRSNTMLLLYKNKSRIYHTYDCENCNSQFKTTKKVRKERKALCSECKRITKSLDITKITTIFALSKKTMIKILNRLNLSCFNCGWNKTVCDVHHIIPRHKGGNDEHDNLTYICPNCHRLAHNNKIEKFITLESYIKDEWKKYYLPKY